MPVFHFVFHAYGSWLADHVEGYYDKKAGMKLGTNDGLGNYERQIIKNSDIEFSPTQQSLILQALQELQQSDGFRPYGIAVVPTHIHLVVSWNSKATELHASTLIKQRLTYILNKQLNQKKGKWFSRGVGKSRIYDPKHLSELIQQYIPRHGKYVWIDKRIPW